VRTSLADAHRRARASAWIKQSGRVCTRSSSSGGRQGWTAIGTKLLRFLDEVQVPVDNNQAERDLRIVKLQQKISGCWRTLAGAPAFLTVRSDVSTARNHEVDPLRALRQLFRQGSPWLAAPAGP
jgi:hypothetical protein